jgi:hypothetical protein
MIPKVAHISSRKHKLKAHASADPVKCGHPTRGSPHIGVTLVAGSGEEKLGKISFATLIGLV